MTTKTRGRVRIEPSQKRIRARIRGVDIVDSIEALMV